MVSTTPNDQTRCGNDYGWTMFEGARCNDGYEGYPGDDCAGLDRANYAFPVFQYCHFDYDSSAEEFDACGDRSITGLSIMGETDTDKTDRSIADPSASLKTHTVQHNLHTCLRQLHTYFEATPKG